MGKMSQKDVDEMIKKQGRGIERMQLPDGRIMCKGPWLNVWYDDYTECLRENTKIRRLKLAHERGLNGQFQTPEQEASFKARMAESKKKKERAEIAAEMATQNK